MKLLFDENLSPRLVPRLSSLFAGLIHVRDIGLQNAKDRAIWDWAAENGYSVVTSDHDFVEMSEQLGWPPKIIHVEKCDYPFRVIEEMLRRNAVAIAEFEKDRTTGVLAVRPLSQI